MGAVRLCVSGGTGAIGREAVRALVGAGHEVLVLSRSAANTRLIEELGASPVDGHVLDRDSLTAAYAGCDAAVNLATHVPVGYAAARRGSWRTNDTLRTTGVANVVEAARACGVRRLVQESVSLVYADHGDEWISEESAVEITDWTEPAAIAETHIQEYACDSRVGVVLRFGTVVGDDPQTRFWLRAAAHGRPTGVGQPDAWTHLIHQDDLGPAVLAALVAPNGIYNVGAVPVTRSELVDGYAVATGGHEGAFMGPLFRLIAGRRMEPLTRSLRVSSDHFSSQTGWRPVRPKFDTTWFDAARATVAQSA